MTCKPENCCYSPERFSLRTLKADCSGFVRFAVQEFQPPFNSQLYTVMKDRETTSLIGRFIHVVEPIQALPNRFRLISLT